MSHWILVFSLLLSNHGHKWVRTDHQGHWRTQQALPEECFPNSLDLYLLCLRLWRMLLMQEEKRKKKKKKKRKSPRDKGEIAKHVTDTVCLSGKSKFARAMHLACKVRRDERVKWRLLNHSPLLCELDGQRRTKKPWSYFSGRGRAHASAWKSFARLLHVKSRWPGEMLMD